MNEITFWHGILVGIFAHQMYELILELIKGAKITRTNSKNMHAKSTKKTHRFLQKVFDRKK